MTDTSVRIPKNVGIIMDGNGRWASERGLSRKDGHTQGIVNMIELAVNAFSLGVENFVCYSLSTENLSRDMDELSHILGLVIKHFDNFIEVCKKYKICAKYIGNLDLLPESTREAISKTERILSEFDGQGRTMYIAIAYGSRHEIIKAVNEAVRGGKEVDENTFLSSLMFPMELDLVIRTGGERRLSNFFLYQSSYAELYFSDKYFPDFRMPELKEAVDWFSSRSRRYGVLNK